MTSAVSHLSCLTPFHRGRAHTRHSKDNNLSQAREVASRLAVRVCGTVTGRWPARFDPESAGLGDDQNLGLAWTANLGPIFLVTLSITGPCGTERLSPRPGVRVGLPKAQAATWAGLSVPDRQKISASSRLYKLRSGRRTVARRPRHLEVRVEGSTRLPRVTIHLRVLAAVRRLHILDSRRLQSSWLRARKT